MTKDNKNKKRLDQQKEADIEAQELLKQFNEATPANIKAVLSENRSSVVSVRIPSELLKQATTSAHLLDLRLNKFIKQAIEEKIARVHDNSEQSIDALRAAIQDQIDELSRRAS